MAQTPVVHVLQVRYDGLLDHALLYPSSFATHPQRVKENYRLICETFAAR